MAREDSRVGEPRTDGEEGVRYPRGVPRGLLALLLLSAAPAAAQESVEPVEPAESAEAAAAAEAAPVARLRRRARRAVAEGRFEDAFAALRRAAGRAEDPAVWRELAEVADRLRLDRIALDAYERYLEAAPDAADRAELEGRVRVLRQLARGARYVAAEDGRSVELEEAPGRALPRGLMDWQGHPQPARRSSELLSLARWDGTLRAAGPEAPDAGRELLPFPTNVRVGLGRRLDPP